MLACPTPHISEHWPKKIPSLRINKEVSFSLPIQASILTPNEGIAQLCNTSAAVTRILV
jgi:hypothetical protein